jgi:serine O-acetyltransferase
VTASQSGYLDAALAHVRANQPRVMAALVADAKAAANERGERSKFHGRADALLQVLRLALECDGFLGLCIYRVQARVDALGMRRAANVLRRVAVITANVSIGRMVRVRPGVFLAHGNVVIDGLVEIDAGTVIMPGVTIGLREGPHRGGLRGPTIGKDVEIGTGAKILGPITLHRGARIGANAVVLRDVPAGATAIGVPATVLRQGAETGSLR